jgi:hypothetical protein
MSPKFWRVKSRWARDNQNIFEKAESQICMGEWRLRVKKHMHWNARQAQKLESPRTSGGMSCLKVCEQYLDF